MFPSNGRAFHGRVQRLEALTRGLCQHCRAREALSDAARTQRLTALMATHLGVSPDQIDAVIATLRAMTAAEIQVWVDARNSDATSP
jgi:hypothetical protein